MNPKHLVCCVNPILPIDFDYGATDTINFDSNDLLTHIPTSWSHIQTANGKCVWVHSAGLVDVSSSIHLKNYLLIPSLSYKL